MDLVIAYDVSTGDRSGQRRLRKVAQTCQNFGQRVQYSVFECHVSEVQFERLRHDLLKVIDPHKDSLRIYRLYGKRNEAVEVYGIDRFVDFTDPLIL